MAKPTIIESLSPESPLSEAGPRLLAARLADLTRTQPAPRAPFAIDAVHDCRVAGRRFRAALKLFGDEHTREVGEEARRLGQALGAVRDLHVQIEWVETEGRKVEASASAALQAYAKSLRAERPRLETALAKALMRWERHLEEGLPAQLAQASPSGHLGDKHMRKHIRKRLRKLDSAWNDIGKKAKAKHVHALRIVVKKTRYELELLEAGFGAAVKAALTVLVPLQKHLGKLHDCDVRLERLEVLKVPAKVQPSLKALSHQLKEERDEHAKKLRSELDELIKKGLSEGLEHLLKHPRRTRGKSGQKKALAQKKA